MATTTRVLTASVSGTVYTTNANGALEAIDTCHSGATAPTDELANGKFWLDTTTTPGILKIYNNATWEVVLTATGTSQVKLDGIEALADVTDVTNVTAAGALMDSELTSIASVKAMNQGVATTDSPTFATVNATTFLGDGSSLTGISSFNYITASGATHALDVGSYDFFDAGALTADTTVSFASVPTEARWTYTFEGTLGTFPYVLSSTTYNSKSITTTTEDTAPRSPFFKSDGTKMYILGNANDRVYQYTLSTAWDVSTATYDSVSFSLAAQGATPIGLVFSSDGTKMYTTEVANDRVNQYTLSTAWDLSTASYTTFKSVASQETTPICVFFKSDGLKMYVLGNINDTVYQYTLSTAWNVSTATYDTVSFSLASQLTTPYGLLFSSDGTKMFALGTGSVLYQYSLSTAWDVSTATYDTVSFDFTAQNSNMVGAFFKPDGTKLYTVGIDDTTYQYDLAAEYTVTLPAAVENPPTATAAAAGERVSYTFFTKDGGTTVTLIDDNADVGTSIAGLGYGDVGTYVFGRRAGSTADQVQFVAGTTYAGSTLYPAGISSNSADAALRFNTSSGSLYSGEATSSALSGTWRAMGTTRAGSTFRENPVTIFVRIS